MNEVFVDYPSGQPLHYVLETVRTCFCFDLLIPVSKAKYYVWKINKDAMDLDARITAIDFGPQLSINGDIIQNVHGNKMIMTLEPGLPIGERAISDELFRQFLKFFKGKVCPDPVEDESILTTE